MKAYTSYTFYRHNVNTTSTIDRKNANTTFTIYRKNINTKLIIDRKKVYTAYTFYRNNVNTAYTILLPRPLSNDPRIIQFIYRYCHASKRFVEVYL